MSNRTYLRARKLAVAGLVSFVTISASQAHAGFHMEANLKPVMEGSNTGLHGFGGSFEGEESVNAESTFGYDLRTVLGYAVWDKMVLGVGINLYSTSSSRGAGAAYNSMDRKDSRMEYGPTIGYRTGGWRFLFTYILGGERKITDRSADNAGTVANDYEITQKVSGGYQFTAGYAFNISPAFQIGPTLIYRKVDYSKETYSSKVDPSQNYTDKSFATKATQSELLPYLSIVMSF